MQKHSKTQLFLSHSSKDKSFAGKLANRLKSEGYLVWYDDWEIKIGDSIIEKVQEGVRESDFLLIILSTCSVSSEWVHEELNSAMIKNIEQKGVCVLPLLIEKCEIPAFLKDKKYADFSKDFDQPYNFLIDSITHHTTRFNKNSIEQEKKTKQRILIVDDEEDIHRIYRDEFEELGYYVESAFNGQQALEKVNIVPVDIIIMDIQMPGMNGIDTLRQIKLLKPDVPIILSSAYAEFKQDLGTWASDEYIVKSGNMDKLKETVARLLE
jgi:two-component system, response regulator, stage 0 sporulation protein F